MNANQKPSQPSKEGSSFEDRLRTARQKKGLDPKPARGTGDGLPASSMGLGLRVGTELVSALAVGLGIGLGLDWLLGTRPIFLAIFVLMGGAAGIANVWRLMGPPK
jgi:ATP synthase protein I